ncbi:hypothetical protein [Lentzea sp. HUAS12]|uniref:hypothetical protein n=1 Tax=Lentzea sp. HUAS12 TaxID=2951806 RepID=UPI0020A1024E|nr:hypothetical protein [Lentzea sp. HUAS12]USX56359.1 hypothetical protein ND450_20330 [Lentzea sp. HUAS12]
MKYISPAKMALLGACAVTAMLSAAGQASAASANDCSQTQSSPGSITLACSGVGSSIGAAEAEAERSLTLWWNRDGRRHSCAGVSEQQYIITNGYKVVANYRCSVA